MGRTGKLVRHIGACGHEVTRPGYMRCRACIQARKKTLNPSIGLGVDGRWKWRAPCGHLAGPYSQRCQQCRKQHQQQNQYLGKDERGGAWLGSCGHVVRSPRTKRCRPCFAELRMRAHPHRIPKLNRHRGWNAGGYRWQWSHEGKFTPVHRQKAEVVLGRPLRRDEIVHHLNGDKADNRNGNLLICTRRYHQLLHHRMGLAYAKLCGPPPEEP